MRYLSVCSGIEAASVAWQPLGFDAVAFAEIERFPSAVLAHHYPDVPNRGDMTGFKEWPDAAFDVLVGGTPCQSFSVAGLRKGLDDPRGNLALTYLALADRFRPRWLVWENVPGVLSSDDGGALGAFLGGLAELGYGFAYRVLDAQYFGLAQRRARVFVVGHLGDWRRAAAVLFERESLSGHPAPGREAGEDVTGTLSSRASAGGGLGTDFDLSGGCVQAFGGNRTSGPLDVATVVRAHGSAHGDFESETFIAHSRRADGFDASEDGTGRGTPLVAVAYSIGSHAGAADADVSNRSHANGGPSGMGISEELAHSVRAGRTGAIAFSVKDHGADAGELAPTLRAGTHDTSHANGGCMPKEIGAEAVAEWGSRVLDSLQSPEVLRSWLHGESLRRSSGDFRSFVDDRPLPRQEGSAAATLRKVWQEGPDGRSSQGRGLAKQLAQQLGKALPELPHARASAPSVMQVRRLTPRECERLMGFPDDYTLIPYRGKLAADGPRYKALGNSMAVPVMRWIGQRILSVDLLATGGPS